MTTVPNPEMGAPAFASATGHTTPTPSRSTTAMDLTFEEIRETGRPMTIMLGKDPDAPEPTMEQRRANLEAKRAANDAKLATMRRQTPVDQSSGEPLSARGSLLGHLLRSMVRVSPIPVGRLSRRNGPSLFPAMLPEGPLRVIAGAAISDPNDDDNDMLIRNTDAALYAAKHAGGRTMITYSRQLNVGPTIDDTTTAQTEPGAPHFAAT